MPARSGSLSRRPEMTLAAAAFGALLAPGVAHAVDATVTNKPSSCIATSQSNLSTITIDKNASSVTAKSTNSGNTTVLCPLTIKNSGPGVTADDGIKSVALTTKGTASCTILTRRGPVLSWDTDLNDVSPSYSGSKTSSTAVKWTINTSASRPTDYWHAHGYTGSGTPAWYYSYLSCQLAPGASISGDITTTEYGPDTGYTIDPMFTCGLDSNLPWVFDEVSHAGPPLQAQAGGYIRAQAGSNYFTLTCPVPANSSIQVMTSSPGLPFGCNLNNSNLSAPTWYQDNYGAAFPVAAIPQPWTPVIETQAQGTNTMYCGGIVGAGQTLLGDNKWASYRVSPNLSRTSAATVKGPWGTWKGNSTQGTTDVDKAYDNDGGSRWTSNTAGKKGMWFDIDLGANWANLLFNQLTFDSGTSSPDDYPRQFTVLLSYDDTGKNFYPLLSGTSNNHQSSINFSEQSAKHVRIQVDKDIVTSGGATKYWSIRELNLYFNGN